MGSARRHGPAPRPRSRAVFPLALLPVALVVGACSSSRVTQASGPVLASTYRLPGTDQVTSVDCPGGQLCFATVQRSVPAPAGSPGGEQSEGLVVSWSGPEWGSYRTVYSGA